MNLINIQDNTNEPIEESRAVSAYRWEKDCSEPKIVNLFSNLTRLGYICYNSYHPVGWKGYLSSKGKVTPPMGFYEAKAALVAAYEEEA